MHVTWHMPGVTTDHQRVLLAGRNGPALGYGACDGMLGA
jgi:hypothetical protein